MEAGPENRASLGDRRQGAGTGVQGKPGKGRLGNLGGRGSSRPAAPPICRDELGAESVSRLSPWTGRPLSAGGAALTGPPQNHLTVNMAICSQHWSEAVPLLHVACQEDGELGQPCVPAASRSAPRLCSPASRAPSLGQSVHTGTSVWGMQQGRGRAARPKAPVTLAGRWPRGPSYRCRQGNASVSLAPEIGRASCRERVSSPV